MSNNPFITYHVHTYNRLSTLQLMLESFEESNEYENFEWVIVDLGSTDGTQDFLYEKYKNAKDVSIVLGNRTKYAEILKSKNLEVKDQAKGWVPIFGWAKNIARSLARGDYFIDIADDHIFIKKGNWVQDMLDVFEHRKEQNNGVCDISSIIYRGLSQERVNKSNNATSPEQKTNSGVSYFLSSIKGYDDYHMMKKSTYKKVGPYLEIADDMGEEKIRAWRTGKSDLSHYKDYVDRCTALKYKKAFLKIPFTVDCDYSSFDQSKKLVLSHNELEKRFDSINRPISTEEVSNYQSLIYNG